MKKQSGSSHLVVVIVLTLALITALGWIVWQNFIHKEPVAKETEIIKVEDDKKETDVTLKHYVFSKSGSTRGRIVASSADVDKYLPEISPELKTYLKSNVGVTVKSSDFDETKQEIVPKDAPNVFEFWEVYGNYAVGYSTEFSGLGGGYSWWGLAKDGKSVKEIGGGQEALTCQALKKMGVPIVFKQSCYTTSDGAKLSPYDVWSKDN